MYNHHTPISYSTSPAVAPDLDACLLRKNKKSDPEGLMTVDRLRNQGSPIPALVLVLLLRNSLCSFSLVEN